MWVEFPFMLTLQRNATLAPEAKLRSVHHMVSREKWTSGATVLIATSSVNGER